MLRAIPLDAEMSVSAALERMARYGLWLEPNDPAAQAWIAAQAKLVGEDFDAAAERLARDLKRSGVAIRRQLQTNILWYALPVQAVLRELARAAPNISLREALQLREEDSVPPVELDSRGIPTAEGVVLDGDRPVGVILNAVSYVNYRGNVREIDRGMGTRDAGPVDTGRRSLSGLWPKLDSPQYVPAGQEFTLTVGLDQVQQKGIVAGPITITAPAGSNVVDLTVELTADGLDAIDGWSKPMPVSLERPTEASVTFRLIGRPPQSGGFHLTTLEVRYVSGGSILGAASRPLIIGLQAAPVPPPRFGANWLSQPEVHTACTLKPEDNPADLTIELTKPDRNFTTGCYLCRLYSPHQINTETGPYEIDLGTDAKSFVSQYVDNLQRFNSGPLADIALRSLGELVARHLPAAALDALAEVAAKVAPEPPTILLVSAEPYVPWELASFVDRELLFAKRPPYLGAQAVVGRWLRDSATASGGQAMPAKGGPALPTIIERPPTQPPSSINVGLMAVMAGVYSPEKMNPLPGAVDEAAEIAKSYDAMALTATAQSLAQLLNRQLERNFKVVGGVDAFHFAGHGYFDQATADTSMLYLNDGTPVSSMLFRSARYGGEQQPLFFLNACMIGTGGTILNDMGGFPGNCLRGGFGGLIGAFWVVDDIAAKDVAIDFWRRALTTDPAEPVAKVLWDLRSKYDPTASPQTTYLAYVFYGHPRLALRRRAPGTQSAESGTQQTATAIA
jgi:Ternary complex associated domain 7/CHAT domain